MVGPTLYVVQEYSRTLMHRSLRSLRHLTDGDPSLDSKRPGVRGGTPGRLAQPFRT